MPTPVILYVSEVATLLAIAIENELRSRQRRVDQPLKSHAGPLLGSVYREQAKSNNWDSTLRRISPTQMFRRQLGNTAALTIRCNAPAANSRTRGQMENHFRILQQAFLCVQYCKL